MSTAVSYPHIRKARGRSACLERFPRVRIAQIVMDHLSHGWSAEEICRQHSYLTPSEAHAALAYYFDNRGEIDLEIRKELEIQEGKRPRGAEQALLLRLRSLKKKRA